MYTSVIWAELPKINVMDELRQAASKGMSPSSWLQTTKLLTTTALQTQQQKARVVIRQRIITVSKVTWFHARASALLYVVFQRQT